MKTDFDPSGFVLSAGAHRRREDGMCIMEAVAYVAGEPHSDHPKCACPVIAAFCRTWNDGLPSDADRSRLLGEYVPELVDTRSTPEIERRRGMMILDWLIRDYTPRWLDLLPETRKHADALRRLPEMVERYDAQAHRVVIRAWAAVRAAPQRAAHEAAWGALRAATRAAAGDAAQAAVDVAVEDAAGAETGAAARAAVWPAARAAVWPAARAAAGDAAWNAVWNAVWQALTPTVEACQQSARSLLDRMITLDHRQPAGG